jgi:hypothetical protein
VLQETFNLLLVLIAFIYLLSLTRYLNAVVAFVLHPGKTVPEQIHVSADADADADANEKPDTRATSLLRRAASSEMVRTAFKKSLHSQVTKKSYFGTICQAPIILLSCTCVRVELF